MNNRDDFDQKTKDILAKRVAYRCSNPKCQRITSGPNLNKFKATSIGIAAHICAAAPGGPRYDPNMSNDERRSIDNGIWLCSTCARIIDSDPIEYTKELLYNWKDEAELLALKHINSGSFNTTNNNIPIEDLNVLISSIDFILKIYDEIHTNHFYDHYRIAYNIEQNINTYNMFVSVYNKCSDIFQIKSDYYLQLQKIGIVDILDDFLSNLPKFYEETESDCGQQMIATISSYLNYFKKLDNQVIYNLEKVLNRLKNIY
uniref:hypothetical protein n=1 Tax=Brachyspira catarrhinii TaxID=2528966 RepID=UPI003F4C0546